MLIPRVYTRGSASQLRLWGVEGVRLRLEGRPGLHVEEVGRLVSEANSDAVAGLGANRRVGSGDNLFLLNHGDLLFDDNDALHVYTVVDGQLYAGVGDSILGVDRLDALLSPRGPVLWSGRSKTR